MCFLRQLGKCQRCPKLLWYLGRPGCKRGLRSQRFWCTDGPKQGDQWMIISQWEFRMILKGYPVISDNPVTFFIGSRCEQGGHPLAEHVGRFAISTRIRALIRMDKSSPFIRTCNTVLYVKHCYFLYTVKIPPMSSFIPLTIRKFFPRNCGIQ